MSSGNIPYTESIREVDPSDTINRSLARKVAVFVAGLACISACSGEAESPSSTTEQADITTTTAVEQVMDTERPRSSDGGIASTDSAEMGAGFEDYLSEEELLEFRANWVEGSDWLELRSSPPLEVDASAELLVAWSLREINIAAAAWDVDRLEVLLKTSSDERPNLVLDFWVNEINGLKENGQILPNYDDILTLDWIRGTMEEVKYVGEFTLGHNGETSTYNSLDGFRLITFDVNNYESTVMKLGLYFESMKMVM